MDKNKFRKIYLSYDYDTRRMVSTFFAATLFVPFVLAVEGAHWIIVVFTCSLLPLPIFLHSRYSKKCRLLEVFEDRVRLPLTNSIPTRAVTYPLSSIKKIVVSGEAISSEPITGSSIEVIVEDEGSLKSFSYSEKLISPFDQLDFAVALSAVAKLVEDENEIQNKREWTTP